jgi:general secretion pathway protein G
VSNHLGTRRSGPAWDANICINNLRQVDGAKEQWALENGKTNGDTVVTENDIKPYLRLDSKGNLPQCPSGGKYVIGRLNEPPTCSLGTNVTPAHVLQ